MMNIQLPDRDDLPKPPPVSISGGAIVGVALLVAVVTVALVVIGFLMARLG